MNNERWLLVIPLLAAPAFGPPTGIGADSGYCRIWTRVAMERQAQDFFVRQQDMDGRAGDRAVETYGKTLRRKLASGELTKAIQEIVGEVCRTAKETALEVLEEKGLPPIPEKVAGRR